MGVDAAEEGILMLRPVGGPDDDWGLETGREGDGDAEADLAEEESSDESESTSESEDEEPDVDVSVSSSTVLGTALEVDAEGIGDASSSEELSSLVSS